MLPISIKFYVVLASLLFVVLPGLAQTIPVYKPVELVLVMDNSGSMRQNDPQRLSHQFLGSLISSRDKNYWVAIISFAGDAKVLNGLKHPHPQIEEIEEKIDFTGRYTNIPLALKEAYELLKADGRKDASLSVVLLTDGKIDLREPEQEGEASSLLKEKLLPLFKESCITIYTVGVKGADVVLLEEIAYSTNGKFFSLTNQDELSKCCKAIEAELKIILPAPPEAISIKEPLAVSLPIGWIKAGVGLSGISCLFLLFLLFLIFKLKKELRQQRLTPAIIEPKNDYEKIIKTLEEDINDKSTLLEDKEGKIRSLTEEYHNLSLRLQNERENITDDERMRLFSRLSPVLTQLPNLENLVAKDPEGTKAKDILNFFLPLRQTFLELGFEEIGAIGEETDFNPLIHEPIENEEIKEGVWVKIRYIGYRYKETIIHKAKVIIQPLINSNRG